MTDAEAREMQLLRNALENLTSFVCQSHVTDGETVTVKLSQVDWDRQQEHMAAGWAALNAQTIEDVQINKLHKQIDALEDEKLKLYERSSAAEAKIRRQYEARAKP